MTLRLLLGGARSGKSSLAVRMAAARDEPVTFVATGAPSDDEMRDRIARHRAERPASWTTVEEPVELRRAVAHAHDETTVIIDCLTLWVANVLDRPDETIERDAREAAALASARSGLTVVVSNEVGSGIVPFDAEIRRYRDLLGRTNACWAEAADAAWLVVGGRLLPLLPADQAIDD